MININIEINTNLGDSSKDVLVHVTSEEAAPTELEQNTLAFIVKTIEKALGELDPSGFAKGNEYIRKRNQDPFDFPTTISILEEENL